MRRPLKAVSSIALVAVLAVTAAACGSSSKKASTKTDTGGSVTAADCPVQALTNYDASKGRIKVPLWYSLTGESKNALTEMAASYNKSQTKVTVQPQLVGKSYDEVLAKYLQGIPSKQLPAGAYIEDNKMQTMVDSKTVVPGEACMEASGLSLATLYPSQAVRNYYTVQGVFYPAVLNVSEPILYYNKTLFTKAGLDPNKPPQTFAEIRADAQALKKVGVSKPFAFKLDPWFIESWLGGEGVDVVNNGNGRTARATAATFATPQLKQILTFWKQMQADGLIDVIPKTSGNINQYLDLSSQKSAMLVETSTAATNIKAFLGGTLKPSDLGVGGVPKNLKQIVPGAGPIPGVTTPGQARVSGGAFYIMNTTAPEVQAATWDFMKYMLQIQQQVKWHLQGSYLPAVKGVSADPEVQNFWKTDLAGGMLKVGYDELNSINPRHPGALIGAYSDYETALRKMLEGIYINGQSVDSAMSTAQSTATKAIDTYNQDNAN